MAHYYLSANGIMEAVEKIPEFLTANGVDRKDAMRIQFESEDILLTYQRELGENTRFEIIMEKRMGLPRVIIRVTGRSIDPFAGMAEEEMPLHKLMESIGSAPVWSHKRGQNVIVFSAGKHKKLSSLAKVLIAVALGIGLGILVRLLPGDMAHVISTNWMAPIQNVIMGFLSCLSALFILLSVTSGICDMGDVSTFNRIGRKLIGSLMLSLFIITVMIMLVLPVFFPLSAGAGEKFDFSTLWQMLINIVPVNIIETFSTGNTMQIVFMSIFASVVLLTMGPKAQQLVDIITQLADMMQQLLQGVITLMPVVVFVSLFRLNADGDIGILTGAYKYPLFMLLACLAFLIIRILLTSIKHKLSPVLLIKKLLPTLIIAASTASSAAALGENLNTCENRLGINKQVYNVGIPLGQTIFMPSMVFILLIGCLCASEIFGVEITLPSYIMLGFTSYIVAIATPPVPGAAMATFTLVLTQMGIPSDAMSFIIALDVINDRIATGTYIAGLQMELIDISASLNLLDNEKLHAPE